MHINLPTINSPNRSQNSQRFDQNLLQNKNERNPDQDQSIKSSFDQTSSLEKKNSLYERFMDFSKIVFSRESTYRGFVDIFADDIPNIIGDAFRGKAAFLESCFKSFLTTTYIFTVPSILKKIARFTYKTILPHLDNKAIDALMLFGLGDLESDEKLKLAKKRIIEQESEDSHNQEKFYEGFNKSNNNIKEKLEEVKSFINDFNPDQAFRERMYDVKKNIFGKLSWYTSCMGVCVPIAKRLFRKYVLGTDRFVGSMNYLNDKDAQKLGNTKGFSVKQILLNALTFVSVPSIFNSFLNFDKNSLLKPIFEKFKSQIDTRHSYHPKVGLIAPISSLPYLIGKMINSQDRFELFENVTRFAVSCSSLYLGDRATNGVFAKAADKQLAKKHGVEPGILYYKDQEDTKSVGGLLAQFLPEAAKINHVLEKTKDNKPLQEEATDLYRKIFYKGFFFHSAGTFLLKLFINWITKFRVEKAMTATA